MDIKLKHRIIGAIVIVALIVIFVPMLFSKHRAMNTASLQEQPETPTVPQVNATTQPQVVTPSDDTAAAMDQSSDQASDQSSMTSNPPVANQSGAMQEQQPDQQTTASSDQTAATNNSAVSDQATTGQSNVSQGIVVPDQGASDNNNASSLSPETVNPAPTTQPQNVQPQTSDSNASAATTPLARTPSQTEPTTKPLTTSLKKWQFHKAHLVKTTATKKTFSHASSSKRLAIAKAANQAWIVQVGSFSGQDHAKVLIAQLRKKGFTAFGYPTKVNNEVITRVYVGPAVTMEKAKVLQDKLQTAAKIKGIVVKFDASKLS
ncbi:MAG: SPOR domain-containing protein [Pseudomonadota bacterium]|nr:SPOR domain-containing protein [Gammaproteobacteria bacterium]MBU2545615.1 SPOR domain-containing protein [Gammaproteobacteria bacterium]